MIEKLREVVEQIKAVQTDLAFNRANELRVKKDAWLNCPETSLSARDKYATYAASEHTIAIWELEAQLHNLIEEKWMIKAEMEYGASEH